jgi:hypothetical protein
MLPAYFMSTFLTSGLHRVNIQFKEAGGAHILKKICIFLMILAIAGIPVAGLCDFVIDLDNGARFVTPAYWKKDQEILFYVTGGIMGVEQKRVRKIVKRHIRPDAAQTTERIVQSEPIKRADAEIQAPAKDAPRKEPALAKEQPAVDFDAYRAAKIQLQNRLDQALARMRQATADKDNAARDEAQKEMRDISGQIYRLTDEVKEKNKGVLPEGWW